MSSPRALLFDLDGTLVDSRGDIAAACNAALVAEGKPALPLATILPMVGDGSRALVVRALSVSGLTPGDEHVEATLARFLAYYVAHPCVFSTLLPGARAILEEARAAGRACALVTNKPRAATLPLLAALAIDGFFGAVWAGGDGALKPAPDGLLAVLAQLDVAAVDGWMIGDGPQDIGAGKAVGCFTVGVPGIAERERLYASGADLVCETLDELRATLQRLTARPA